MVAGADIEGQAALGRQDQAVQMIRGGDEACGFVLHRPPHAAHQGAGGQGVKVSRARRALLQRGKSHDGQDVERWVFQTGDPIRLSQGLFGRAVGLNEDGAGDPRGLGGPVVRSMPSGYVGDVTQPVVAEMRRVPEM
ncbi:hypothetical protein D3C85_1471200 [compost metagenome]